MSRNLFGKRAEDFDLIISDRKWRGNNDCSHLLIVDSLGNILTSTISFEPWNNTLRKASSIFFFLVGKGEGWGPRRWQICRKYCCPQMEGLWLEPWYCVSWTWARSLRSLQILEQTGTSQEGDSNTPMQLLCGWHTEGSFKLFFFSWSYAECCVDHSNS